MTTPAVVTTTTIAAATLESTCGSTVQERVTACSNAIEGGYREPGEEEYDPVDDTERAQEMGQQFVENNIEKGRRVNFDGDAYERLSLESPEAR